MEYSVNLASSVWTFTYHRQYFSLVDILLLMGEAGGGGGQNIKV